MSDRQENLIVALLDGQQDQVSEALEALDDDGMFRVLAGAFATAVYLRFPEDPDIADVARFVDHVRVTVPAAQDVEPAKIEAAVRTVLGESGLQAGIPAQDLVDIYVSVIRRVAADHIRTAEAREAYLASVREALR